MQSEFDGYCEIDGCTFNTSLITHVVSRRQITYRIGSCTSHQLQAWNICKSKINSIKVNENTGEYTLVDFAILMMSKGKDSTICFVHDPATLRLMGVIIPTDIGREIVCYLSKGDTEFVTHTDTIGNIVNKMGGVLTASFITKLQMIHNSATFNAQLQVLSNNNTLMIDCRIGLALSIAAKHNLPIFLHRDIPMQ